jgi:hypothetical protein
MRITVLFLLFAFALVPAARGQTLAAPWTLASANFNATFDTCNMAPEFFEIPELGFYSDGAAVVLRVQNTSRFGLPTPLRVTMVPYAVDFSIFVCRTISGSTVSNCVDGSENGFDQTNVVDVPGAGGTYYVIVAQNAQHEGPDCGYFSLNALHEPQYYSPVGAR